MRLAGDPESLASACDAVVVGSGAGAAVAASRLARMGLAVVVLERGRELEPGLFPDTSAEVRRELAVTGRGGTSGRADGLYNLRHGEGGHVLSASALGGTSLLGAGVMLAPDPRVWEDPRWPSELLSDGLLDEGFRRAHAMYRPSPWPAPRPLEKLARLGEAARRLAAPLEAPPLAIAFAGRTDGAGRPQPACNHCGDCLTGCNVGARTTARDTYLTDAADNGARLFTGIEVEHVERAAGAGWHVVWRPTTAPSDAAPHRLAAAIVVLGAGSIGSTEILLRSARHGLALSPRTGSGLWANGAIVSAAWNGLKPVEAVGTGVPPIVQTAAPGPAVTAGFRLGEHGRLDDGVFIAEAGLPSAIADLAPGALAEAARRHGQQTSSGMLDEFQASVSRGESARLGAFAGSMRSTQVHAVSGHDASEGRLVLDGSTGLPAWPDAAADAVTQRTLSNLVEMATANDATFIAAPLAAAGITSGRIVTEPLGGAVMGRDRTSGVVDHGGRVFDADAADPAAVHAGLYVMDAAIVTRPLGVPPLLTVTALIERAMMVLADRLGRQLTVVMPPPGTVVARGSGAPLHAGAILRERLSGWISDRAGADHETAARVGRDGAQEVVVELEYRMEAAAAAAVTETAPIRVTGRVIAQLLDAAPLAAEGELGRSAEATDVPGEWQVASLRLRAWDGRELAMTLTRRRPDATRPATLLRDATTVACDVTETAGEGRHWRGVLEADAREQARALAAIELRGGTGAPDRLAASASLGRALAGPLYDVHGMAAAVPGWDGEPAGWRKRRALRSGTAELHHVEAGDGTSLRLLRFDNAGANRKGPLLLVHGLGTSSRIFALDTVDTSLLEYMTDRGFDCWLLDTRASVDLAAARRPFSADDCARHDYQPTVDLVRRVTGAATVQLLAHCFGALTATMALLHGSLRDVRSAVLMQVGADIVSPSLRQRMAARARLASLVERLGLDQVAARAGDGEAPLLADLLLGAVARLGDRDVDLVSGRMAALYGDLVETAQLDPLTLEKGLPGLLGETSIAVFAHLAVMVRRGHVVDQRGEDVYLPNLERLAFPITFVHGMMNGVFAPEGTHRTYEKLVARNGARLYERHLVPNYGHLDCLIGRNAAIDVFPKLHAHLERSATPA